MRFFSLGPEAAGELGANTIGNTKERPHRIERLHLELTFWPEDDLIDAYTYVCTKKLAETLTATTLTGFRIDQIYEISKGDQFEISANHQRGNQLPEFVWLKITGKAGVDDFGLVQGPCALPLVVSERALQVLKACELNHCKVVSFSDQSLQATG